MADSIYNKRQSDPRSLSIGVNMMEGALTAYAGKGRPLSGEELNALIDELALKPYVQVLNERKS
jgi:hypothetical protein